MTDIESSDLWCSVHSVEVGEQLFGSASNNDVWLLLEYSQAWGAKVLPESDLAASVKAKLNENLASIPKSNLLFIKQQFKHVEGLTFYVVIPSEQNPRMYEFRLQTYDDLLTLDVAGIVAGDMQYDPYLTHEPLYLVCTNGKRDRCCAKFGLALYRELAVEVGSRLWQCSHLGGHRFAPTALFFPHGITYGRIAPGEAATLAQEYRHGRINIERMRGRACYDNATQAADYYLREHLEIDTLDALRHAGTEKADANNWLVKFDDGTATHTVHIRRVVTDVMTQNSCPPADEIPLAQYELVAHNVYNPLSRIKA